MYKGRRGVVRDHVSKYSEGSERESRVAVETRYLKARCHEILADTQNKRYLLIYILFLFS